MDAGRLTDRLRVERRGEDQIDRFGNTEAAWVAVVTVPAAVIPLRGSEQIIASRLQGVSSFKIMLRDQRELRGMDARWRLVDARDATRVFNVRSALTDERKGFIDIVADIGPHT